MTSTLHHQIQDCLRRYLSGTISLPAFEQWFIENSWNVHRSANHRAHTLTSEIEGLIADLSAGDISKDEFKVALRELADQSPVHGQVASSP